MKLKLFLLTVLIFLASLGLYLVNQKKDGPVSKDKEGIKLEFSSGPCEQEINPFEESSMGIKDLLWIDNKTLQVKASISLNCADKVEKGEFEIQKNKIILKYFSPRCEICALCVCPHELTYRFSGLERGEYQFELIRID